MKTIGIVGGTTWHSTSIYYKKLNEGIQAKLKNNNSAKILLYSFNYQEVMEMQESEQLQELQMLIIEKAMMLEKSGADCILLAANTMHRWALDVQSNINIPLIHIVDAVASEIRKQQIETVGLLGTKTTMTEGFYKNRLALHDIHSIIPESSGIEYIQKSIFNDFAKGNFSDTHKKNYIKITM